jgi:hypothetical protein
MLTRKTLADGVATLCGSHAMLAGRRTLSLPELVAEAFPSGDRRQKDRRNEDRRTPTGRRQTTKVGWLFESNRRDGGRRTADAKTGLGVGRFHLQRFTGNFPRETTPRPEHHKRERPAPDTARGGVGARGGR